MAKEYDKKNPAFAKAELGVTANHSSSVRSVATADNAQSDDALQDVAPPQDPNISGMTPTEDCYTFVAGQMDGWRENDDYRRFFENSVGCDGMLVCDPGDGDYDDNGGVPTAVGHDYGIHGTYRDETEDSLSRDAYPLGPVIQRRI
jgi:hypothetical protein